MNGFWQVLSFELRLRFRQISTYAFFAVLFGLVFATMTSDAVRIGGGGGPVQANAPYLIFVVGTIFTVLGGMILSATMGTAVYRDFEANAHELFFSTGVGKAGYLLGRFFGSYLVTAFVFLAIPFGIFAATFAPWVQEGTFGAFRADAYLQFIGVFLLPNLLVVGALFFVWGAITRNLLAIYAQSVVLFVAWAVSITLITAFNNETLGAITDPFGITAAVRVTRYWTVAEKNNSLIPITGYVLGNRLFWLCITAAVLGVGYELFAFAKTGLVLGKRRVNRFASEPPPIVRRPTVTPAPTGTGAFRALVRLTRFYLREIVTGIPFIIIGIAGMILLIIAASTSDEVYDTPIYPVTRVMAETISTGFLLFFIVLITFYAGELTWRERVLRLDQIADTTPVGTATVMLAKIAAVVAMLIVTNGVLMLTGMGIQTAKGYFDYEPGLYLAFLFGDIFPHIVALTFLAFFVHALVDNKAVGHLCMILLYAAFIGLESLGFNRQLYLFGSTPSTTYSDMNGFGPFAAPLFWWNLYWLSFAVLLLVAARKLWVRGVATSPVDRWRRNGIGAGGAAVAGVAGLLWLGTGAFNTYNTDVLNEYDSSKDLLKLSAKYERDYKGSWEKKPMPRVVGVSLDVSLYPERLQYDVRGTYTLKNKTTAPIREVALDFNSDYTVKKLAFGVPARAGVVDKRIGFRTFTLSRPLQPGETTTLAFDLRYEKTGFPNDDLNTDIAANGTFLTMPAPSIGYRSESEISDETERKKHGLPPRPRRAPASDAAARQNPYIGSDADWIDFEATVRTAPDQIALAPGYLQREWTERGRRCFRYKMDAPILNFYTFVSGRYKIKRDTWTARNGEKVALSIYYHPAHPYNLDRMMAGAKASLSYCSQSFSPYQFRQLRIVEFPVYAEFAQSFPNTVPYSEGIGFIARVNDKKGDIDYPYFVTAHEVAHQWWAHQVVGADVAGAEMLSESLAEYSALMVMQRRYGKGQARKFLAYELDRYLDGRGDERENEEPLVRTSGQQYIHYSKGALVFYALGEEIGHEKLTQTLSRFLKDKAYATAPYPTAPELLEYLETATPRKSRAYLSDLFERITLYDCETSAATKKKLPGGKWRVTLSVSATKLYADGKGMETEAALDYPVAVGVFAAAKPGADDDALGKPLYFQKRRIKAGGETFSVEVTGDPAKAGIDPYSTLIDREADDNVITVGE